MKMFDLNVNGPLLEDMYALGSQGGGTKEPLTGGNVSLIGGTASRIANRAESYRSDA
jgi:hypothetical protein